MERVIITRLRIFMRLWKIEKQKVYVKIYVIYENIKSEVLYIDSIVSILSIKIWNRTKQANSNNDNNNNV